MGGHGFAGRKRPATSPGKPVRGAVPKPASDSIFHSVSAGSDSAIFAAKKKVIGGPVKTQFGYYVFTKGVDGAAVLKALRAEIASLQKK